jgi:hypothetical protein
MHTDSTNGINGQEFPFGQVPPEFFTSIENATRKVFAQHGASAFTAPKNAAVAHECGHAVVGTHQGLTITSVSVFQRGSLWGGWCACDKSVWRTGPDTSAENDLAAARMVIAGLAGKAICGLDRPGSSLDETVLSQIVGLNAALKLAGHAIDAEDEAFAEQLWHEQVWGEAVTILRDNREPFQRLAEMLMKDENVRGGKLRRVLAPFGGCNDHNS